MPRKVHVVTTSGFSQQDTPEQNREKAASYIDAAGKRGADLVCLPENFLARGGGAHAEALPGPTFDRFSGLARRHQLWIVAGYCIRNTERGAGQDGDGEADRVTNCAVVIDRRGEVAGCYAKVHPTIGECQGRRIVPGAAPTVVETDFGKLGLAICYDIGWPAYWAELAGLGAELVVWPSAYDGGFPLSCYAWFGGYRIVTAVRSEHAKVIDLTGSVLAETSRWHPVVSATVDLESELFHADTNETRLQDLETELAGRVRVTAFDEERYFTLESDDPEWPVSRIKTHYRLENFRDFHSRATAVQDEHRERAVAGVGA
jgi:hypothetical protein